MPVHTTLSSFRQIKLTSNDTAQTATIVDTTPLDCTTNTVFANITTSGTVTLIEWLNDLDVVIFTGNPFVTATPGDYTCRVTLDTGCIILKEFSID